MYFEDYVPGARVEHPADEVVFSCVVLNFLAVRP